MRLSPLVVLLLLGCGPAAAALAETVPVPPFSSVQLRNGGEIRIAHGDDQRVTVVGGEAGEGTLSVENGRLRIDRCPGRCSHLEPFRVDIVTPRLDGVAVEEGGRVILLEGFPRQPQLAAAVSNGGAIDVRALDADQIVAAVAEGGVVYTRPRSALVASVNQGGVIYYWGDPTVTRSVQGGNVLRGLAADAGRSLDDMMPHPPAVPPVPPVPALPKPD